MNTDIFPNAKALRGVLDLPARLNVSQAARLLGFADHEIQVLMGARKLIPLGDPAPNAPKWFAAVEIIRLGQDLDWLSKATKEVSKHWRQKRERRESHRCAPQPRCRQSQATRAGILSPDSSRKPSPKEESAGDEQAIASNE